MSAGVNKCVQTYVCDLKRRGNCDVDMVITVVCNNTEGRQSLMMTGVKVSIPLGFCMRVVGKTSSNVCDVTCGRQSSNTLQNTASTTASLCHHSQFGSKSNTSGRKSSAAQQQAIR